MEIEELLVAIGVDTSQAAKIKEVVVALGVAATQIANEANKVNKTLDAVGEQSIQSTEQATQKAKETGSNISKLKMLALGVSAVVGLATAKVLGFIDSSLGGAKALAKEKGALFKISEQELKQADEYQEAMKKTGLSIDSIKTKIALNLVPQLTSATQGFNHWLGANKELISEGLTEVIKWGAKVIQMVVNSVRAISLLIEKTIGWKAAMIALVAILAVLKRAMLMAFITNPITWVIAGIVGLMLLLDDLMVYLDGGDSLFGEFWGPAIEWVKSVITWWNKFYAENKVILDAIGEAFKRTFEAMMDIVGGVLKYIANSMKFLVGLFTGDTDMMSDAWKGMTDAITQIWEGLKAYLSGAFDGLMALFQLLGKFAENIWEGIKRGAVNAFLAISSMVSGVWREITSFFKEGVKSILMSLGLSEDGAEKAVTAIGEAFSAVFALITYPFTSAWEFIKGLFSIWGDDSTSFTEKLGKTFSLVTDTIKKPFMIAFEFVETYFNKLIGGIKDGIASVKSFFGFGDEEITGEVTGHLAGSIVNSSLQDANLPNLASATTNNKSITINQGDIQVQQSIVTGDPQKAASLSLDGINKNGYKLVVNSLDSVLANGG
ncbi:TPA: phage tail protein [Providencia alcalifaciens]